MREGTSLAIDEERLIATNSLGETMMLGLRMLEGVDLNALRERFGLEVETVYADHLKKMMTLGLIVQEGARLRLTREGLPMANDVWAGFIA